MLTSVIIRGFSSPCRSAALFDTEGSELFVVFFLWSLDLLVLHILNVGRHAFRTLSHLGNVPVANASFLHIAQSSATVVSSRRISMAIWACWAFHHLSNWLVLCCLWSQQIAQTRCLYIPLHFHCFHSLLSPNWFPGNLVLPSGIAPTTGDGGFVCTTSGGSGAEGLDKHELGSKRPEAFLLLLYSVQRLRSVPNVDRVYLKSNRFQLPGE